MLQGGAEHEIQDERERRDRECEQDRAHDRAQAFALVARNGFGPGCVTERLAIARGHHRAPCARRVARTRRLEQR